MENPTHCPNCATKLKGLVSLIQLYKPNVMEFIHEFAQISIPTLCSKCGKNHFNQAKHNFTEEQKLIKTEIKRYYRSFPVLTIQPQPQWKFDSLGLVTAQATMDNRVNTTSILDLLLGVRSNTKYTIENLNQEEIFDEVLDSSKRYSFKNPAAYILLEKDLRGLNNLRTKDYLIMFKYGSKEIHFIPIENGKTNSANRQKYKMNFSSPIETALTYGLENEQGDKTFLSIESDSVLKGTFVIKHVFKYENKNYCKRGILVGA